MTAARRWAPVLLAAALFFVVSAAPWHTNSGIRSATALAVAALTLWASECAPLGVVALGIPVVAALSGVLRWKDAISAWGDSNVFLFLGAFLLARAMDKHGVFDAVLSRGVFGRKLFRSPLWLAIVVMFVSGAISTVQNNTAVTAMLLPVVVAAARKTGSAALPVFALSFGATFGGMATPVGTAPNVMGYGAVKQVNPDYHFLMWLAVGVPAWIGCSVAGLLGLRLARGIASRLTTRATSAPGVDLPVATAQVDSAPLPNMFDTTRAARRWALAACLLTAAIWLGAGFTISVTPGEHWAHRWVESHLPESLVPIAAAWLLFFIPIDRGGRTVLERGDLQQIDWDTLFLIAGGFCLGKALETSGAADELGHAVAHSGLTGLWLMLALGATTVLLSEVTSNTVTAALLVPVAKALAVGAGLDPTQAIVLVALCASLGFAMPISTPPNALVYGTGLVPLRLMLGVGLFVDVLCILWVVACVRWLA